MSLRVLDHATPQPPHRSVWRRRMFDPVVALLTQGVTAEKIAQTLAVATICSLFPFLGTTTLLNLGVGLWLRMNQPIMQSLNYLLTPVHLMMIVVYVRIGEWVWLAGEDRFTIGEMLRVFREETFVAFVRRFGVAGGHAFTAWLLTAPLVFVLVYYPLRPIIHRLARRIGTEPPR